MRRLPVLSEGVSRRRRRSWPRVVGAALLVLVLVVAALWGLAHLFTSRWEIARAVSWFDADVGDWRRFPSRPVPNAPPVHRFARGTLRLRTVAVLENGKVTQQPTAQFLASTQTAAFLILRNDRLIYERYFNGYRADSTVTSFSVAKSFVSALVGIAIHQHRIHSVDDPVTRYVPELARRDPRFERITLRDLIGMASGLRYTDQPFPWSDPARTYYSPYLRDDALHATQIVEAPGRRFVYNPYNYLLLGLVLERATHEHVATYLSDVLWKPLGMQAPGSWSLDSTRDGFEKMESGLNGRAIDFAKLGELYLHDGRWGRRQLVPKAWVRLSTTRGASTTKDSKYALGWWTFPGPGRQRAFMAWGNKGEYVYVVPARRLVIVRFGINYGYGDWPDFFRRLAARL